MKITIESTTRIVDMVQVTPAGKATIEARVWEGTTEFGIKVYCLIPQIAVHNDSDQYGFERELVKQKAPSMEAISVFPLRMVI